MRTGEAIPYEYSEGQLSYHIPSKLKAAKGTDVVIVEFGQDFDFGPYTFTHW